MSIIENSTPIATVSEQNPPLLKPKNSLSEIIKTIVIPIFGILACLTTVAGGIFCCVVSFPVSGVFAISAIVIGAGSAAAFTVVIIRGRRSSQMESTQTIAQTTQTEQTQSAPAKRGETSTPSWAKDLKNKENPDNQTKTPARSSTDGSNRPPSSLDSVVRHITFNTPEKDSGAKTPRTVLNFTPELSTIPEERRASLSLSLEQFQKKCAELEDELTEKTATSYDDEENVALANRCATFLNQNKKYVEDPALQSLLEKLEAFSTPKKLKIIVTPSKDAPFVPEAPPLLSPINSEDDKLFKPCTRDLKNSSSTKWLENLPGNFNIGEGLLKNHVDKSDSQGYISLKEELDQVRSLVPVCLEILRLRDELRPKVESQSVNTQNMKDYLNDFKELVDTLIAEHKKIAEADFVHADQKDFQNEIIKALTAASGYITDILGVNGNEREILEKGNKLKGTCSKDFKGLFNAIDQGLRKNDPSQPMGRRLSTGMSSEDAPKESFLNVEIKNRGKKLSQKKDDESSDEEEEVNEPKHVPTPKHDVKSKFEQQLADVAKRQAEAAKKQKAANNLVTPQNDKFQAQKNRVEKRLSPTWQRDSEGSGKKKKLSLGSLVKVLKPRAKIAHESAAKTETNNDSDGEWEE